MPVIIYSETSRVIAVTESKMDFEYLKKIQEEIGEEDISLINPPEISISRASKLRNERLFKFYKAPKSLNREAVLIDYANLLDHVDPLNSNYVNEKSKFIFLVWGKSPEEAEDRMKAVEKLRAETGS